jgi:hypothetical protein
MPLSTSGYVAPSLGKVHTTELSGMAQSGTIYREFIIASKDVAYNKFLSMATLRNVTTLYFIIQEILATSRLGCPQAQFVREQTVINKLL